MPTESVQFAGHSGDRLAARLDLPDGKLRAVALLAHCFTCSKDIPAARRIAGKLASFGIATLRFDFTGLGHSQGEFASTNFSSNVEDLVLAARHLADRDMPPQLLIGHSLGGSAAIKAAPQIDGLKAVVTIGAPADPAHVAHNFAGKLDEIREKGRANVTLAGRTFEIRRQFIDDIEANSLKGALSAFGRRALLVMHSPLDTIVGIDKAALIFSAAKHPKSFITLDDADHLITRETDAEYVAEVILAWSRRYINLVPDEQPPDAPEGVVRVSEADAAGFRQDVTVDGRHHLMADEPASFGGTNLGPSPYQLLSAGLGACTTMTIRMYARRKRIALEHVSVDVTHDKRHSDDLEHCEEAGAHKVDVFHRAIRLEGDLTDDQRSALLAIAEKCPVHRTLHGGAIIKSTEV